MNHRIQRGNRNKMVSVFVMLTLAVTLAGGTAIHAEEQVENNENQCYLVDYDQDGVVGGPDFNELQSQFELLNSCFGSEATGECASVDYDANGVIGGPDFNTYRERYNLLLSCFGLEVGNDCSKVDFDGSGIIGGSDFNELRNQYGLLQSCFGGVAVGDCATVDYDQSGVIGANDFNTYRELYGLLQSCFGLEVGGEVENLSLESYGNGQSEDQICRPYDYDANGFIGSGDFNELRNKYDLLSQCFGGDTTGDCILVDYDGSGTIGSEDVNLFRGIFNGFISCFGEDVEEFNWDLSIAVSEETGNELSCSDFDFDANGVVGSADYNEFRTEYGLLVSCLGEYADGDCARVDYDASGIVGADDENIFRALYEIFRQCFGEDVSALELIL